MVSRSLCGCFLVLFISFTLLIPSISIVNSVFMNYGKFLLVLFISWHGARFLKTLLPRHQVSPKNRAVLITGCDSGFGFEIAKRLDSLGFHVFAGCLFPDGSGAAALQSQTSNKLKIVQLDITSECDIKSVIEVIKASKLDLWGLINNAGISNGAYIEEGIGLDVMRQVFEVNVFGLVSLTKQCLPLIRKSCGRVVNIASLLARITIIGSPIYCMSKHAVRSFSDSLRQELKSFNVNVICIEPAMYQTSISDEKNQLSQLDRNWLQTSEEVRQSYGKKFIQVFKQNLSFLMSIKRTNINDVIDAVEDAVTNVEPNVSYKPSGLIFSFFSFHLTNLPENIQDVILSPDITSYVPGVMWQIIRS